GRAQAMEPAFAQVLATLRKVQDSGGVGFRLETDKETGKRERLFLFFTKGELPPELQGERENLRKLLHLSRDRMDFLVIYGADTERDDVVAIQTRSPIHILHPAPSSITLPQHHI